jgi:hypothetical protein
MNESENPQTVKRRKRDRRVEGTRLLREANALIDQGELVQASNKLREGVDLYCHSACYNNLEKIISAVSHAMTMENWQTLYTDATVNELASAQYFVSYIYYLRRVGHEGISIKFVELRDLEFLEDDTFHPWWMPLLIQACNQGHGYGMFMKGLLGIGKSRLRINDEVICWFRKAELLGVAEASVTLMHICCIGSTPLTCYKQAMIHAKRGAQWGNRKCIERMKELVRITPREVTPWSQWTIEYHWTCMKPVKHAIKTWMLVSNRQSIIPKGVRMMINEYICTETKNEQFCKKWQE